jgi:hypothetical protein
MSTHAQRSPVWFLSMVVVFLIYAQLNLFVTAHTTLAPDERRHVKTIIAKLTKVQGGQHGNFQTNKTSFLTNNDGLQGLLTLDGQGDINGAQMKVYTARPPLSIGPPLSIDPPFFDFGSHYTCTPSSQEFQLTNLSPDSNMFVEIHSLTTSNLHFHISSFSPITLGSNQTKSIKIMYLPYTEGYTSAVIVLRTSIGGFLLSVTGEGIKNPYGVTAFTDIRVPVGIPYDAALQVYNPFSSNLLIKEIFTTEAFLLLTLPEFVDEMDKVQETNSVSTSASIWQVKPREIKDVIQLSFRSHSPGNYRGFLHIKTSLDNLVVPIDIIVLKGGIHAMPEYLEFGATVPGQMNTIPVTLLNSDTSSVEILAVSTRNVDATVAIQYEAGCILPPQKAMEGAIKVSVSRSSLSRNGGSGKINNPNDSKTSGFIVIRTNHSVNAITKIPYSALFLQGNIGYQADQLMFPLFKTQPHVEDEINYTSATKNALQSQLQDKKSSRQDSIFTNRTIRLVNNFDIPLMMQFITLPDSKFGVNGLMIGSVAQPGEAWPPFWLHFKSGVSRMMYNTTLMFHSNVTVHRIPIQVYHGQLDVFTEDYDDSGHIIAAGDEGRQRQYFIDFGIIATNETRRRILNLSNPNPVPITVHRISKSWRALSLRFAGLYIDGANESVNASQHQGDGLFVLQPHALTSFMVILRAPTRAKISESRTAINFYTSSGNIRVGAKYEAAQGQLIFTPSKLHFDSAFPGLVLRKSIFATNTYPHSLRITNIEPRDSRIIVQYVSNDALMPNVRSWIADVLFDPSRGCTVNGSGIVVREPSYFGKNVAQNPTEVIALPDSEYNTSTASMEGLVSSSHHMEGFRITTTAISDPSLAITGQPGCVDLLPYQNDTKRHFLIEDDIKALELREINWAKQQASGQTSVRTALRVDSTILSSQKLEVRATLKQPTFVAGPLDFGIVRTGTAASLFVEVHNPSSLVVQIELVPPFDQFDDWRPNSPGVLGDISNHYQTVDLDNQEKSEHGLAADTVGVNSDAHASRYDNFQTRSVNSKGATMHQQRSQGGVFWVDENEARNRPIVMAPFATQLLGPIRFRPHQPILCVDTFYLRNNLTGVATINVKGKGGQGELRLYDDGIFIPNLHQYLSAHTSAVAKGTNGVSLRNGDHVDANIKFEQHAANGALKSIKFEIQAVHLNISKHVDTDGSLTSSNHELGLTKTLRVWNSGTLPMEILDISFLPAFFAPHDVMATVRNGFTNRATSNALDHREDRSTSILIPDSVVSHPDVDELYNSLSLLQKFFVNINYFRSDYDSVITKQSKVSEADEANANDDLQTLSVGHARRFGSCSAMGFEILDCEDQFAMGTSSHSIPSKGYLDLQIRMIPDCASTLIDALLQIRVKDGRHQQLLYNVKGMIAEDLIPVCRAASRTLTNAPSFLKTVHLALCTVLFVGVLLLSGKEMYVAVIGGSIYGFQHESDASLPARVSVIGVGQARSMSFPKQGEHSSKQSKQTATSDRSSGNHLGEKTQGQYIKSRHKKNGSDTLRARSSKQSSAGKSNSSPTTPVKRISGKTNSPGKHKNYTKPEKTATKSQTVRSLVAKRKNKAKPSKENGTSVTSTSQKSSNSMVRNGVRRKLELDNKKHQAKQSMVGVQIRPSIVRSNASGQSSRGEQSHKLSVGKNTNLRSSNKTETRMSTQNRKEHSKACSKFQGGVNSKHSPISDSISNDQLHRSHTKQGLAGIRRFNSKDKLLPNDSLELARREMIEAERMRRVDIQKALEQDANQLIKNEIKRKSSKEQKRDAPSNRKLNVQRHMSWKEKNIEKLKASFLERHHE